MRIRITSALFGFMLIGIAACGGKGGGTTGLPQHAAAQGAPPGSFQVLAVNDYRCGARPGDPGNLQGAPMKFAADLTRGLTTGAQQVGRPPWTALQQLNDAQVTIQSFTQNAMNIDALFYAGHGQPGGAVIDNPCGAAWGAPSYFSASGYGLPITGRLKWIFFSSSTSVAPDPNNFWGKPSSPGYSYAFASDMRPFFRYNQQQPGSLHGVYGSWMGPGTCNPTAMGMPPSYNDKTRICDMNTGVQNGLGKPLAAYLWDNSTPLIVRDAWFNALGDAGFVVGASSLEDQNNVQDTFTSGGGINPNPGGLNYVFTYTQGTGNGSTTTPQSVRVNPDTFALTPLSLQTESINDAGKASQAQSYLGQPVSTVNDGRTTVAYTADGRAAYHGYADSGAAVMVGPMQSNAVQFDQATAYNAATTYITNTFGMPSDAALASVANVMESFEDGSVFQIGYVFTFLHQTNGIYGGDALRVRVDDALVEQMGPCLSWAVATGPTGHPVRYCEEYSVTYVDQPNISYSYRLWRAPGQLRQLQSAGRSTGQSSIDALTASYSLPAGTVISGYSAGYWTTGVGGSASDGAQPAWIFNMGSNGIAGVDAFSGQYLGATTL